LSVHLLDPDLGTIKPVDVIHSRVAGEPPGAASYVWSEIAGIEKLGVHCLHEPSRNLVGDTVDGDGDEGGHARRPLGTPRAGVGAGHAAFGNCHGGILSKG
jgi:hypothetical protein